MEVVMAEFSYRELQVLWYLKRHGGKVVKDPKIRGLGNKIASELCIPQSSFNQAIRALEHRSVVIRTYQKPLTGKIEPGNNPLLAVEMVDPFMELPPIAPTPLGVVVAFENRELAERTEKEPSVEKIILALVDRAVELQKQIDKLQDVVEKLSVENTMLKQRHERKPTDAHLQMKVQSVLTNEQWDSLRRP
jgi:hypothetical protein